MIFRRFQSYRVRKTLRASEQERLVRQEPHRLVFLDETGTSTKMTRLRGRCLKEQRLYAKGPFGHWLTQTFVASLRCYELIALRVIEDPMTRTIFEAYVETQLAPVLSKGDVVILDSLPTHNSERLLNVSSRELRGFSSRHLTVPI